MQGHSQECLAGLSSVPGRRQEQLTQTLIVRLLKKHFCSQDTVIYCWRKPWLCLCWKKHFFHRSIILKSQENRIKFVTRLGTPQRFPPLQPPEPASPKSRRRWRSRYLPNYQNHYQFASIYRQKMAGPNWTSIQLPSRALYAMLALGIFAKTCIKVKRNLGSGHSQRSLSMKILLPSVQRFFSFTRHPDHLWPNQKILDAIRYQMKDLDIVFPLMPHNLV